MTITLIPKERSITNELKVICVDNHKKTHTEASRFKSVIVKSHYYISIALYLTDTWKKEEKNMSGFKIISVHEYQNRTRLVLNKYMYIN